jgi:hypothetical protein
LNTNFVFACAPLPRILELFSGGPGCTELQHDAQL